MKLQSFHLAADRKSSPAPFNLERRCRGGRKHRRGAGDRFPPAYREPHEARILAEMERVQAELLRRGDP